MKLFKLFLVLFLICTFPCIACLNGESKILKSGHHLYEDNDDLLPFGHDFFEGQFDEMVFKLDSIYKKTNDLAYLSDKGLVLILQKKYDEALQLYLKIEKLKPNRYSTASNIGTIYELIGDNQKALEWIEKAVRINPESHNGSEWIHVNILKAKIKGQNYFTSEFLLGTNFGNDSKPTANYDTATLTKLDKALYYQLNERISFIKPKDPIIALLLFELGNIKLIKNDFRNAAKIFEKAGEYGLKSEILKKRIAFTKNALNVAGKEPSTTTVKPKPVINYTKTVLLIITLSLGLLLLFKFLRKNRK